MGAPNGDEKVGCKSIYTLQELIRLKIASIEDQYITRLGKLIRLGDCKIWTSKDRIVLGDTSDGLTCVNIETNNICYWSDVASGN
ncbi:hypothetical protein [Methylobacterium sp. Leaf125]|uniref:hypothetical protein n=1 Tax=Methylobacterium sp. Leaf125 TaxID=1736265 RepID=UPI0012E0D633|nr:hypothetical protein [Methylobacterium sp. Leaf125]